MGKAAVLLSAVLLGSCVMNGCAAPGHAQRGKAYAIDRSLPPSRNLERLAAVEERDASLRPRHAALPPGVEPHVLAPRPATDHRARASLAQALSELAAASGSDAATAPREPRAEIEPAAESAALRHYVRGRESALAGRHYQAITEFHRALELDPDALPVMRELARSHQALGNTGKVVEFYGRIVQIDPSNREALFGLALAAANRREWEKAASMLAGGMVAGASFDHDPAAEVLAHFTLAVAMRNLGYDRASIEASREATRLPPLAETMYEARLASLHRQQSELWRGIGDAHCRLGEYAVALDAYAIAAALPSPDPSALNPRVMYANLRLGRTFAAQYELLSALRAASIVSDRDIRLCGYVADHVEDISLLREEAIQTHRAAPDEPSVARVAAALLPPAEAAELLREFVSRRPRDVHVAAQLLAWFGARDLKRAVEIAAQLIDKHPDLAGEYVGRLVFSAPRPSEIIRHARGLSAGPAASNIESRVLVALGALGEAWETAAGARERWPHDASLLWLQLELAALLEEPTLLRGLLAEADRFADPITWMFRARAHRGLAQSDEAIEAAERAHALASRDAEGEVWAPTRVLMELALSYHTYAVSQSAEAERRTWAQEAAIVAGRVLDQDPSREAANELLLGLYAPSGLLNDAGLFRETAQRLFAHDPQSRLYARLSAEELIGQGRHEAALERLVNLYDSDPHDTRALALAVEAWTRRDQLDAARTWLSEKLRERPGDPALLEQWVTVMLRQERAADAVRALSDAIEREPRNYAATRLLESVYRATGQLDRAFAYGERRLLAMPRGVRRDVELAALYGGAGMERRAIQTIEGALRDYVDDATFEHLLTATAILGRMDDDGHARRRDELKLELASHIVERFPNAPLQVYGIGLNAMAKLGMMDGRFDRMAERAAGHMPHGAGGQVAVLWRDLAQALVNAGEPAAAARALRAIINAERAHSPPATDLLVTVALAADAAAGEESQRADESIALIEHLAATGRLPRMPGMDPEAAPTIAKTLYHASQIYSILGNHTGVETLLRRAVAIAPDDAMSLNNLGYMRIEAGFDDEATVEWIERAHRLEPEDSHILDTIGWLRYRQGVWKDVRDETQPGAVVVRGAASLIEGALAAVEEPVPEVYDHLGDVYWRLARHDEAIEMWERAEAILSEPAHHQRIVQNLQLVQVRGWGVLVADPQELYDRTFGAELERVREKLRAVWSPSDPRGERKPPVAPTFAEMKRARAME